MEEKLVAHDPSIGYVTRESNTPRRASGTFVPPVQGQTPRRSPRLLAKRIRSEAKAETAIATPVREALKRTVLVHSTEALQHLVTVVDEYDRLKCCRVKAAKDNKLADYLVASRRTMIDDERIGPHDGVRLIVYDDGRYKFLVYEHLLKEGTIQPMVQIEVTSLLAQMNDSRWTMCPGITEYSQYKCAIGYDIHRVKICCWPPDRARDCECAIWYRKEGSRQSDLCEKCVRLKWQLVARRKSHGNLSPTEKLKRQSASSKYPFEYLSPRSKKIKLGHLRQSIADIRQRASEKVNLVDRHSLPTEQSDEICEMVSTIQQNEEGQHQLQQIFTEADQSGEGRGELLKEIWDRDVADMEQFFQDQKSNGICNKKCTQEN